MDNWDGKKFRRAISLIFIFYFVFIFYIEGKYNLVGITELQILKNVSLTFGLVLLFFSEAAEHINKNAKKRTD